MVVDVAEKDAFDHLMDRFSSLCSSISGDNKEKLEQALATAKQLMDGKTTTGVRKDTFAQQELKEGFAALKDSLSSLVETMPERIIDLDEPEEVV